MQIQTQGEVLQMKINFKACFRVLGISTSVTRRWFGNFFGHQTLVHLLQWGESNKKDQEQAKPEFWHFIFWVKILIWTFVGKSENWNLHRSGLHRAFRTLFLPGKLRLLSKQQQQEEEQQQEEYEKSCLVFGVTCVGLAKCKILPHNKFNQRIIETRSFPKIVSLLFEQKAVAISSLLFDLL